MHRNPDRKYALLFPQHSQSATNSSEICITFASSCTPHTLWTVQELESNNIWRATHSPPLLYPVKYKSTKIVDLLGFCREELGPCCHQRMTYSHYTSAKKPTFYEIVIAGKSELSNQRSLTLLCHYINLPLQLHSQTPDWIWERKEQLWMDNLDSTFPPCNQRVKS